MIISATIVSQNNQVFHSSQVPRDIQKEAEKHAEEFLYARSIEDNEIEFPYIETTHVRYIYKQTDDLFWLLVTDVDSNMFTDIHHLGRLVCAIMEYGASDTNSSTITEEQCDLFYRHLWRPWDEYNECPTCGDRKSTDLPEIWEKEFEDRVSFLLSIRDGHLKDVDVNYFNGLIAESWSISEKLAPKRKPNPNSDDLYQDADSCCSSESQSISEETVIDGCRLKCRLEDIRLEIRRLQDPYLRLFARRDLLSNTPLEFYKAATCTAPSMEELDTSQSQ